MAGITNTGVVNYISNPVASFPENSITIDIFGNAFYRSYSFGAGDDTGVYWSEKNNYSREAMLFFAISINKSLLGKYDYGSKLRSSKSLSLTMKLPMASGEIDFNFMESFITELETECIAELEDYLGVAGLKDCELTEDEQKTLNDFDKIKWNEFRVGALFEKIKTNKLPFKADELPKEKAGSIHFHASRLASKTKGLTILFLKMGQPF